jgi:hypothetical protein
MGHDQVEPLAQDDGALFGGLVAPDWPGGVGRVDGFFSVSSAEVGYIGQVCSRGGVGDGKTAGTFAPIGR